MRAGNLGLFLLMSLIWGGTWAAVKIGISAVPPVFFAAVRYSLVAVVLAIFVRDFAVPFGREYVLRTLWTGAMVNVGTYSLLFWGMQFVDSGVSGLINLALIPVGLFGLSVLLGDEEPSWRHALALALGVVGLGVLFSGKIGVSGSGVQLLGAGAIVAATFSYCLGTVLSKPLLGTFAPMQVAAAQAIVGAAGLLAIALALEPISSESLRVLLSPAPLAGLVYLVVAGTLAAYTIYLRLVRDWGASRAGLYAFLSPIVALAIGWTLFAEAIGWRETLGAAIMLVGAGLALATEVPGDADGANGMRKRPAWSGWVRRGTGDANR
jgi:drug/metabolite transporter (DMT)-like permease